MDLIGQLWRRVSVAAPVLPTGLALACAALALLLVLVAWPMVRLLTTISHEAGHASMARLCGRRLASIRVHSDTSGLTVTRGRPGGVGMVATILAGYPAPALLGLGLAWLLSVGHFAAALWLVVLGLAGVLVWTRNLYGLAAVGLLAVGLGLASWYAPPLPLSLLAETLTWLLVLAAPRPVVELIGRRRAGSDAAQLAAITGIPGLFWCIGWLLACLAAAAGAVVLLLPGVVG